MGACQSQLASIPLLSGALMKAAGCGHRTKDVLIDAVNNIVSESYTQALTTCASSAVASQSIVMKCHPASYNANGSPTDFVYEENAACKACMSDVFKGMSDQHADEKQKWSDGGAAKVRLPIDTEFQLMYDRLETCGLTMCKACVLVNATQESLLSSVSRCKDNADFQSNYESNLGNNITAQLNNNQDVLSSLANLLQKPDVTSVSQTIQNSITNVTKQEFSNSLVAALSSAQTVVIDSNGGTVVRNLLQNTTAASVVQFMSKEDVAQQAFASDWLKEAAAIANDQNTLSDVGEVIGQGGVTLAKTLESIVGKILLAVLVFLGVVVLFIACMIIYRLLRSTSHGVEWAATRNQATEF